MSISYYDQNGDSFFRDTVDADMGRLLARFLERVPAGGSILDAGCGSGRDSQAFLRKGYRVEAFDGSAVMVRLAQAHTGLAVRQMTFDDVDWTDEFDGIWACASLLHVSGRDLDAAVARLVRALRPGGALFASFKLGEAERLARGRTFTDLNEASLRERLCAAGLVNLDIWTEADVRPGRATERWVSGIGTRPAVPGPATGELEPRAD